MSKNKNFTPKKNRNAHQHCTGCEPKLPGLFEGLTLKVEHLDIHMDERMYSCNHYCGGLAEDDGIEVDMEQLVEKVAADTDVDKGTVMKVIMAEDKYLQELGVCQIILDEEATEQAAEQEADHA